MGSMSSMNISIKNNRNLLNNRKHKPFSKMNGGSSKKSRYKPYVFPQVRPHVLRRVRIKIKKQNRRLLIKKLMILTVILFLITYWIYLL